MSTSKKIDEELLAEEELIIPETLTVGAAAPVLAAVSYSHTVTGESGRNGGWKTFKKDNNAVNSYYFSDNHCKKDGGVILNKGSSTLTVSNSYFKSNYGSDKYGDTNGGAIKNDSTLYVINSTFDSNYSNVCDRNYLRRRKASKVTPSKGGAIYNNEDAYASISGSDFKNNTAVQGGAIYNDETMSISNTSFYCNEAFEDTSRKTLTIRGVVRAIKSRHEDSGGNGGAINNGGYLSIDGATFDFNDAYDDGGAIYNYYQGQLYVSNSTFTRNSAESGYGGAIYNQGKDTEFYINNCLFSGNFSGLDTFHTFARNGGYGTKEYSLTVGTLGYGGAIYNAGDTINGLIRKKHVYGYTNNSVTITGATFTSNAAGGNGGAIYNTDAGGITITNSSFTGNGAGITKYISIGVTVVKCGPYRIPIPSNNQNYTGGLGGAIANCYQGEIVVNGSILYDGNTADRQGGAIYNDTEGDDGTHPKSFVQKLTKILTFGLDDIVNKAVDALAYHIQDEPISIILHNDAATFTNNVVWYDESRVKNTIRYGWDCVGGAISNVTSGFMEFKGALTVTNNVSEDYGGGIYQASNATMLVESTAVFTGNFTGRAGGAIYNDGGSVFFTGGSVTFTGNKVDADYIDDRFSISVRERTKVNHGGAVYNLDGTMRFDKAVTFTQNVVSPVSSTDDTYGGAISNGSILIFNDVVHFSGNTAKKGGAIYNFVNKSSILPDLYKSGSTVREEVQKRIGSVTISNKMYLDTDSDTIYNDTGACLVWDLKWDGSYGYLSDYSKLTNNNGKLKIAVNSTELKGIGSYLLADNAGGDLTGKNTFILCMGTTDEEGTPVSTETAEITVGGGTVTYNGYEYTLSIKNGSRLVLSVGGTPERIVVNNVNFKDTDGYFITQWSNFSNVHSVGVNGGAVAVESTGTFIADECTFSGDIAQNMSGGALVNCTGGTSVITNSIFSGNTAINGGAMANSSNGLLSLTNVTVTGNYVQRYGGAILQEHGTSDLVNVTFSGNTAGWSGGAIYNGAVITLTGGTFKNNIAASGSGGAIYNFGSGTVSGNAVFSGNTASGNGGAVYNSGTITLTGGTFGNNIAKQNGGAIYNAGTITVSGNVVFNGNSASQNGGAVYNSGTVNLRGNVTLSGASDTIYGGTLNWNILSQTDCGYVSDWTKLQSISSFVISGSSNTQYGRYKLAGNAASAVGQVFSIRNAAGTEVLSLTVNGEKVIYGDVFRAALTVDKNNDLYFTIIPDSDHLVVSASEGAFVGKGGTCTLPDGLILDATVLGRGTYSGKGGIFYVKSDGCLCSGGTSNISGFSATGDGGAIYNEGTVNLSSVTFTGNTSNSDGGAICNIGGSLTVTDSLFTGNGGFTAGIYNESGTVSLKNVTFANNVGITRSAFCNQGGTVYIDNVTLSQNVCTTMDEALFFNTGSLWLRGALTIDVTGADYVYNEGNLYWEVHADRTSGYVSNYSRIQNGGGSLCISVDADTKAGKYVLAGDASAAAGQTFTIQESGSQTSITVNGDIVSLGSKKYKLWTDDSNNLTLSVFGRIVVNKANFPTEGICTLHDIGIDYNLPTYSRDGGVVMVESDGTLRNDEAITFSGNTAYCGGAIDNEGMVELQGVRFSNNYSSLVGGAICNDGTGILTNCIFTGNISARGGAVYQGSKTLTLTGCVFENNRANSMGGGAIFTNGTVTLKDSAVFRGNTCVNDAKSGAIDVARGARLNLAGKVYLETSTDTVGNSGTMNWDLTGDVTGWLSNYSLLTSYDSLGTLSITVNPDNILVGDEFILASGVEENLADTKKTFTITGNTSCDDVTITVNSDSVLYDGMVYKLFTRDVYTGSTVTDRELVLKAYMQRIVVNVANYPTEGVCTLHDIGSDYTAVPYSSNGGAVQVESDGTLYNDAAITFSGNTADCGGAIYNEGMVELQGVTFNNNYGITTGGAISIYGGSSTLTQCVFTGNTSARGGGVYQSDGNLTLTGCVFVNNCATNNYGGAVFAWETLTLKDSAVFHGNVCVNDATSGAICVARGARLNLAGKVYLETSTDTVYSCGTINWDLTGDVTGWLSNYSLLTNDGGTLSITVKPQNQNNIQVGDEFILASGVEENLDASKKTFTITGNTSCDDVTITVNSDKVLYDGVLYKLFTRDVYTGSTVTDRELVLKSCLQRIVVNKTNYPTEGICTLHDIGEDYTLDPYDINGGVVEVELDGTLRNDDAITFSGNTVGRFGGAIYNDGRMELQNVRFSNNYACHYGGAVYLNNDGTGTLTQCVFTGNTADIGGAIYCNTDGNLTLTGCTFENNYAAYVDGGALCTWGTVTLKDSAVFHGNVSEEDPASGAIYVEESDGRLNLAGKVYLETNTDTVFNAGTMNWDLTGDVTGWLSNYSLLTSHYSLGTLSITVSPQSQDSSDPDNIQVGDEFVLASGVEENLADTKKTFTITGNTSCDDVTITVNSDKVLYDGVLYKLFTRDVYTGSTVTDRELVLRACLQNRIVVNKTNYPTDGICTLQDIGENYTLDPYDGNGGVVEVQSDGTLYNDAAITFSGNTVTNGCGGAVYNQGTAELQDVTFNNNYASSKGAAICSTGTLTLTDCVFSGNTASRSGGAVYNDKGTMVLQNVQFNNNYATTAGGAVYGGETDTLTNCTFTGNTSARGGAVMSSGNLTVTRCIFENNCATSNSGGAVFTWGTLTLKDSVVFHGNVSVNNTTSGAVCVARGARLNLAGQVYLETSTDTVYSCGTINWDLTGKVAGWLNNYSLLTSDASLGKLSITVKPQVSDPKDPDADENMKPGMEFVLASGVEENLDDSKKTFTITGNSECDDVSITVNGDWVLYDGVNYRLFTREETDDVEGTHNDLILHVSNDRVIVNTTTYPDDGIYTLEDGETLSVGPVYTGADGGGAMVVEADGTLTGSGAVFSNNSATKGGALANYGTVTISDTVFKDNYSSSSDASGGAFYNAGTAILNNVTFENNQINPDEYTCGGAISMENGILYVADSTFTGNMAMIGAAVSVNYGGSASSTSQVDFINVTFSGNTAGWSGAVEVYNVARETAFTGVLFENNYTQHIGGGVSLNDSNTYFLNTTFRGNRADDSGGGLYVWSSSVTLDNVTFDGNTAVTSGGAIYCDVGANIKFAGLVTLSTDSDTIDNGHGYDFNTFTWVLENQEHYGRLSNWRFTGSALTESNLFISVSDNQEAGNYILVEHGAPSYAVFTLNGINGAGTVTITIGGDTVRYGKNDYTLTLTDDQLVLNVTPYTGPDVKQVVVPENESAAIDSSRYYTVNLETEKYEDYKDYGAIVVCSGGTLTGAGTQAQQIVVTGNTITSYNSGAGLCNQGTATLSYTVFSNNTARANGGAINNSGTLELTDAEVSGNQASDFGGGIYNGGVMTVTNVDFSGNTAFYGGAVYVRSSKQTEIDGCTFTGNTATASSNGGGAIYVGYDTVTVTNSLFTGNVASYGSAISTNTFSEATIRNSTFSGNVCTAADGYGTIYNEVRGTLTLDTVTFDGNTASSGGAVYNSVVATLNIEGTVTLSTEADTIVNNGTINWNLAAGTKTKTDFSINDWSLVSGTGNYTVTVDDWNEQVGGIYTLAENVTGDFSVTVKNTDGTEITTMTVSQTATNAVYRLGNGVLYELNLDEDKEVTFTVARGIFLDNTWEEGQSVTATFYGHEFKGTVGDGTFFNDPDAAKAECDNRQGLIVASGTVSYSAHCDGHNTHVESGLAKKMFFGGKILTEEAVLYSNDSDDNEVYMTSVGAGTFKNSFAAGDAVNGSFFAYRASNLNILITGGLFEKRVAGGMYYGGKTDDGGADLYGNINFVITGGTFCNRIYGGSNAQNGDVGICTYIDGDVNILIRAGENDINIGECIVAGSRGAGCIGGDTRVVFSGDGSKLHFAEDSVVFGGSNSDFIMEYEDNTHEVTSTVGGSRDLVFNAYTGDFGAEFRLFKTATIKGNSTVNFTNEYLDTWSIEEWNFEYGSTITGLTANEFDKDTLNFDMSDWDGTGVWNVLSGSYDALSDFLQADAVYFNGSAAEMSAIGGYWSDGTYKLSVSENSETVTLSVTKIA